MDAVTVQRWRRLLDMMPYRGRRGVVHFTSSMNLGGAERFVIDLSLVQRDEGLIPLICSLGTDRDALIEEAKESGIQTFSAPSSYRRKARIARISGWLETHEPMALHIHTPAVLWLLLPILPVLARRHRIIYTRHGCAALAKFSWKITHLYAQWFVDWITFVSREGQNVFHEHHLWSREKSVVIENGVFLPNGANPCSRKIRGGDALRIGSVGRIEPIKGQIHLLEAARKLSSSVRQQVQIHFYGTGTSESTLKEFAAAHLADMRVAFHGLVLEREEIYRNLDVLAVTSESEGMSLSIMEAMARNIPVIATDVGGNDRLVTHDHTGFLVPYADPEAINTQIQKFLGRPDLVDTLGKRARSFIEQEFSLSEASRQYMKCYTGGRRAVSGER